MPPEERFVCRFAAEPPQGPLPYGRWADTLQGEFLAGCLRIGSEEVGAPGEENGEPTDYYAWADYTDEVADRHPEWRMDVNEEVVGGWRGENGEVAAMTLVWGLPLLRGGAVATAELAGLVVDQCRIVEDRFTLLAPDAYRGDYLEIALWDDRAGELARESLYEDDGE